MELTDQEKVLQEVITKAWEDSSFKQELINSPEAAIEKLTGKKVRIPKGKTLVVRDQTDESTIYVNIPEQQSFDDVELNEEQLEAVAGGIKFPPIIFPGPPIFIDPIPLPYPVIDIKAPDQPL
ncbi:NHLP leader peptide family RiPP precursor [Aquimarina sp. 2201CG1-2-11]|uniref:NHLP leader peptide family RiPP precursor n=1 Tax=Aquimarina discodermiae TaxID=3231043 RepID=UPI003462ECA6